MSLADPSVDTLYSYLFNYIAIGEHNYEQLEGYTILSYDSKMNTIKFNNAVDEIIRQLKEQNLNYEKVLIRNVSLIEDNTEIKDKEIYIVTKTSVDNNDIYYFKSHDSAYKFVEGLAAKSKDVDLKDKNVEIDTDWWHFFVENEYVESEIKIHKVNLEEEGALA